MIDGVKAIMANEINTYQITSNYFCAGIIVKNDYVIKTAPIINYFNGENIIRVMITCRNHNWTIERIK